MKLIGWIEYAKKHGFTVRFQQLCSFSVSCYLTMGMFSALVDGAKTYIFMAFGFIYEMNKLGMLKKSFVAPKWRGRLRVVAIVLMTVSVSGAVLSAIKDTIGAGAGSVVSLSQSSGAIENLERQRTIYVDKIATLPPDYRTSALAYQKEIDKIDDELRVLRAEEASATVAVSRAGGVFQTTGELLGINPELLRLLFFVAFILLNEVVLYFETWLVAINELELSGTNLESALDRIKRWKIFHPKRMEEEVETLVRERLAAAIAAPVKTTGAQESLF